jgi:hypothetical protein
MKSARIESIAIGDNSGHHLLDHVTLVAVSFVRRESIFVT